MLINIIGNIATGKSTLAKQLSSDLSIPVLSIDAKREQHYTGDMIGEIAAQQALNHSLSVYSRINKSVILEHCGIGIRSKDYYKHFNNSRIITVACTIPIEQSLTNINNRKDTIIPLVPKHWMDSDDLVEAQLIACKQMDAKQFNIIPDAYYDYNNGKYQELLQWLKREGASGNCK